MPALYGIYLLFFLFVPCLASELQKRNAEIQTSRGIGLEEVVLFLIGLGIASALGLALMIGPLFAIFYSSIHGLPYGGINGANPNTITTTAGGSRTLVLPKEHQDGHIRVRWHRGERILAACIRYRHTSIMVLGVITYTSGSPLVHIDGTLNSACYISGVLRPVAVTALYSNPAKTYV
ncbi:uncharacterized protein TNCV_390031 [Trichonephila clavipes]|nr:uncharacterized protein TNCV_390031 [Trichonephila clavipes]